MATRRVDDSDEGEATALDLRPSSRSAAQARPPSPSPPRMPSALPAPIRRANLADQSSEDDGEATEFLSVRPPSRGPQPSRPSSEAVPRAQGRAVPIEGESSMPSTPSSSSTPSSAPLPAAPPAGLPTTAPDSIRPLPHRTIGTDLSATGTSSVPRVTRIHVVAKGGSTTNGEQELVENTANDIDADATIPPGLVIRAPAPPAAAINIPTTSPRGKSSTRVDARDDETQAGDDPDDTQAPSAQEAAPEVRREPSPVADAPARALPTSAEGEPVPARSRPLPRQNTPQAATDGVLVVDAPPEATVFVNGVERGRGTVKVGDLDREARHAVRIHCQGFSPWSGSVSLQGKPAAKIRPGLKPRAR